MAQEINITYEILFELLRRERNRNELQKLDDNFFQNVIGYLKDKKAIIEKTDDNNIFLKNEKVRIMRLLENSKNIIKDLYERREKKIVEMALGKSRADIALDENVFLSEEKDFFENLKKIFDFYRTSILQNVLKEKQPELKKPENKVIENKSQENKEPLEQKKQENETKIVRIIHQLPKFLGQNLEVYGPFDKEDIANLPSRIADILILKGRAEEIKES